MAAARRRARRSFPVAVIMAVLAIIFSTLSSRSKTPKAAPTTAATSSATPPAAATQSPSRQGETSANSRQPSGGRVGFRTRQKLVEHFEKHGAEFPGLSLDAYLGAAQALRDVPSSSNVLEARRSDGVVTRFDRESGAFLAVDRDGTIRTYFKPNDGERYFKRQAARPAGQRS